MIDPVYKRLLAENAWLRQQISELSTPEKQEVKTVVDNHIADHEEKMHTKK